MKRSERRTMSRVIIILLVIAFELAVCIPFVHADGAAESAETVVEKQLDGMTAEIDMLAKVVWGESRGVKSRMEQAAVVWCILNRCDATGVSIIKAGTAKHQFAYHRHAPIKPEHCALARDVLKRWLMEKQGITDVGRVLPKEYIYFTGHRGHNRFRIKYKGRQKYWNWSLPDPYTEV